MASETKQKFRVPNAVPARAEKTGNKGMFPAVVRILTEGDIGQ